METVTHTFDASPPTLDKGFVLAQIDWASDDGTTTRKVDILSVPLLVAGWLLALGLRRRLPMPADPGRFNLIQVGLALWTLLALLTLFCSIQQGLLGRPDMLVAGNQLAKAM